MCVCVCVCMGWVQVTLGVTLSNVTHATRPSTTKENPPNSNPGEPSRMDKYKDAVKENLLYIYIYIGICKDML